MRKKIILLFLFFLPILWQEVKAMNDTTAVATTPFDYENVRNYIFSNLVYPKQAIAEEIEGTVRIHFTLMQTGEIDSVWIVESVHPLLDAEAMRLIGEMPRWKPLYVNGQPISLSYEIPVIFELLSDTLNLK
ncbi:energy transducer TonB [Odoribacter lunatus]|uniref:energy transducer TonB n=1 Tax=Odoribacter lunatus TaxID=2941335 RepID=UPI0020403987|nr:energy transducer TonB [Odoribacter lunatus]